MNSIIHDLRSAHTMSPRLGRTRTTLRRGGIQRWSCGEMGATVKPQDPRQDENIRSTERSQSEEIAPYFLALM